MLLEIVNFVLVIARYFEIFDNAQTFFIATKFYIYGFYLKKEKFYN